jgi:hypothetical protein
VINCAYHYLSLTLKKFNYVSLEVIKIINEIETYTRDIFVTRGKRIGFFSSNEQTTIWFLECVRSI